MSATALKTGEIYERGEARPVKFAPISASAAGATPVVAAVANRRIRVLSYVLTASGAVNAKFQSGSTDVSGLLYFDDAGRSVSAAFSPVGHFQTAAGEALNINLSGATAVGGHLTYIEVD